MLYWKKKIFQNEVAHKKDEVKFRARAGLSKECVNA
jgi:hypothetical protein